MYLIKRIYHYKDPETKNIYVKFDVVGYCITKIAAIEKCVKLYENDKNKGNTYNFEIIARLDV